jgi:lipopolysaccharide transport system ATP-binding protein
MTSGNPNHLAIKILGLGKKYWLGNQKVDSLRHEIFNFLKPSIKSEFWALQDVSLDIMKGEVVGIIGKNGAGKSTLLKILSQITKPTHGQVEIHGRVASLLEVGTGFHPELTGRENIFLNGTILGMSRKEVKEKFNEIVEFSGVGKFIDTPVKHYSSGMYVRLAFAVAAHLDPEILIIDEVLAVGDAEFQKKCLGKMKDVANKGRTVLFVSHNIVAVKSLCNKGVFINNGTVECTGEINHVLNTYHKYISNKPVLQTLFNIETPRSGSGEVLFTKIETHSLIENLKQNPQTGTLVEFCIFIDPNSKIISSADIQIDIGIDNEYGERIIWLSTSLKSTFDLQNNVIKFIFK